MIYACRFPPLQIPVRQTCHRFYHRHGRRQQLGVPERRTRLVLICTCYLLTSLQIVPDDQHLATLDVFPVGSHRQSVSDLLILGFFGLEVDENIHGDALGRIMQHVMTLHNF